MFKYPQNNEKMNKFKRWRARLCEGHSVQHRLSITDTYYQLTNTMTTIKGSSPWRILTFAFAMLLKVFWGRSVQLRRMCILPSLRGVMDLRVDGPVGP